MKKNNLYQSLTVKMNYIYLVVAIITSLISIIASFKDLNQIGVYANLTLSSFSVIAMLWNASYLIYINNLSYKYLKNKDYTNYIKFLKQTKSSDINAFFLFWFTDSLKGFISFRIAFLQLLTSIIIFINLIFIFKQGNFVIGPEFLEKNQLENVKFSTAFLNLGIQISAILALPSFIYFFYLLVKYSFISKENQKHLQINHNDYDFYIEQLEKGIEIQNIKKPNKNSKNNYSV
ncbi:hypothetical protein ACW95P_04715 [Candidatus Mycoplasma pogonae]